MNPPKILKFCKLIKPAECKIVVVDDYLADEGGSKSQCVEAGRPQSAELGGAAHRSNSIPESGLTPTWSGDNSWAARVLPQTQAPLGSHLRQRRPPSLSGRGPLW